MSKASKKSNKLLSQVQSQQFTIASLRGEAAAVAALQEARHTAATAPVVSPVVAVQPTPEELYKADCEAVRAQSRALRDAGDPMTHAAFILANRAKLTHGL